MYEENKGRTSKERGEVNSNDSQTRANELNRVEITETKGTEEASTRHKFFGLDPTGETLCPVRYRMEFQETQFGDSWQRTYRFFSKKEITDNNLVLARLERLTSPLSAPKLPEPGGCREVEYEISETNSKTHTKTPTFPLPPRFLTSDIPRVRCKFD